MTAKCPDCFLLLLWHSVRIRQSWRDGRVAAANRTHVSGSKASNASTPSDTQLGWAILLRYRGRRAFPLRLHRVKLTVGVPGYPDCHPRHVISDKKRMLALAGLHGAVAGCFGLIPSGLKARTPQIGPREPCKIWGFCWNA